MTTTIGMITSHMAARRRNKPGSANGIRLAAEWQLGVETMSGFPQQKLRLSFAPSELQREASQIEIPQKTDGATSCSRSTSKRQQR